MTERRGSGSRPGGVVLRLSVIKSRFVFPDGVSLPPGWGWRPRCCGRGGSAALTSDWGCLSPLASLAQMGERPIEDREVEGSIPSGSTRDSVTADSAWPPLRGRASVDGLTGRAPDSKSGRSRFESWSACCECGLGLWPVVVLAVKVSGPLQNRARGGSPIRQETTHSKCVQCGFESRSPYL